MERRLSGSRLVVLFCFHNRKPSTLAMCRSLKEALDNCGVNYSVYCVDDGSTDGSADAVRGVFSGANIIFGGGHLFWNQGMLRAFRESVSCSETGDLLCVNDDCLFDLLEFSRFISFSMESGDCVIGAQVLSGSGLVTYGGGKVSKSISGRVFGTIDIPLSAAQEVSWLNFNCVYIHREVVQTIGFLDSAYVHSFGDLDFSLRAHSAGFRVLLHPGVGRCSSNEVAGTWLDSSLTVIQRLQLLHGIKGLPIKQRLHFSRQHFPWYFAPLWLAKPYAHIFFSGLFHFVKRRLPGSV